MTQLEMELRLSSSTGLTNAKIEKLVKRTVRVAHDIPYLRAQLVNFLGVIDFLFTKESFLYSKLAIWIPFIDRTLIQMSRTHLQDPNFIATLSIIIDRKFQGFLSHCTNALTTDDVRKFAFNFKHSHHIRHDHECDLGPRGSFLHRKTTNPKERIAKRKTKSGRRYDPSSQETEVVEALEEYKAS